MTIAGGVIEQKYVAEGRRTALSQHSNTTEGDSHRVLLATALKYSVERYLVSIHGGLTLFALVSHNIDSRLPLW